MPEEYKKATIESAKYSPDRGKLAISILVKRMLGLRKFTVGCVFEVREAKVTGRIVEGQRSSKGWTRA